MKITLGIVLPRMNTRCVCFCVHQVERALSYVDMKNKESAYQAWLGYYNSNKTVAKDKSRLVELANEFSRSMGLDIPPALSKLVLGKMGLKNVPGLRFK